MLTILIATTVLLYALVRFEHMMSKHNPNINDYYVDVKQGHEADLNDINFRIAFTVEDYQSPHRLKDDERFVRWVFRLYGKKDNVAFEKNLPYHKCTTADYD